MLSRPRIALAALAIVALGGLARSEYSPIRAIMGPNSSTISNVACWGDIFGLSLTDCGAFPVANVGNVATNAALKALAGGLYSTVIRTGYAAANDVPAATYTWNAGSSCTDDGGSCIQPNIGSGRWILTAQQRVHAGIFGALGDGSTNDTTALNNASTYVQSLTGPGNTLLLSGRYVVSSPITVQTNMAIEGVAKNSTFIFPTSSAVSCINFNPSGANKTLDLRKFTCSYASLSSSGVPGIQFGNSTFNNLGSDISNLGFTNATIGMQFLNTINTTIHHNEIGNYYTAGISISDPLAPDSGGFQIHDNFIQNFAPVGPSSVGIQWFSGGALDIHNNQIFDETAVQLFESGETSEIHITNNLFTSTGSSTAGVQINTLSASFTCTQSGTNITVTAVTGTIVTANAGLTSLGQTISGTGVAANTRFVSQTSGTPGGAGVYVTNVGGTAAAAACLSTLYLTEVIIADNIFDGWDRSLLVPANVGGTFLFNLQFSNNATSSKNSTAQNQIAVNSTLGFMAANNLFKCNGTCTGRAMLVAATVDKATIWQPTSSKIGAWGAADSILSTNTCGMLGNALVTTC